MKVFGATSGAILGRFRVANAAGPQGVQPAVVNLGGRSVDELALAVRGGGAAGAAVLAPGGLQLSATGTPAPRLAYRLPHKVWSRFCQPGKWDATVAHTRKGSLTATGGIYIATMLQWKYFNRQGAAQLVVLNQTVPRPIMARAFSKARDVVSSDPIVLDTPAARRRHFDAREGHTYAIHLYLDYQDGRWPEVHTIGFTPGTHDWEEKSVRMVPTRPVKTVMVLLEFHQPRGSAWFDDVSLSSGDGAEGNLLACPSFEEADAVAAKSQAISADYETQVQVLLGSVEAAAGSPTPAQAIPAIAQQADDLVTSVKDRGLASYFPRRAPRPGHAREKLQRCARLLAGRP